MSIAYLDPGNIESDLQSGSVAQYRYRTGILIIEQNRDGSSVCFGSIETPKLSVWV
jgi:hypothetical protein